jgi:C4-dicarboxylate transporter DctM subunit
MEDGAGVFLLAALVLILLFDIIAPTGMPDSSAYVVHITFLIAFVGAMITTREQKHLSMSLGSNLVGKRIKEVMRSVVDFVSVMVCTSICGGGIVFMMIGFDNSKFVGIIPIWIILGVIPVCFLVMVVRFILLTPGGAVQKLIAASGIIPGIFLTVKSFIFLFGTLGLVNDMDHAIAIYSGFFQPILAIGFFGTPVFALLGGLSVLLYANAEIYLSGIPQAAYTMLTRKEIPAIPLFTLAGFILAESKTGERFIKLFHALMGSIPGGLAIVTVILCAFFTTFTGASGVTILALGALLSFVLIKEKYKENFSYGLITSAGSIGILFPPSLPVIMYGVAATISIKDLYIGGILPGLFLVASLSIMGVIHAKKNKVSDKKFEPAEVKEPLKVSIWELFLPIVVFASFFSGLTTLVQTGAITVFYIVVLEVFIYRDIKLTELPKICAKCIPIIGGILIVLAIAKGFSDYIVDQQIPELLSAWCQATITSPIVFLLLLNIILIIIGCFLDIYSSILVFAPLIIPLGALYNVHPVHLGIIFLAHLTVANITPPIGVNLFLASYAFNMPLAKVYRNVVPFYILLVISILVITYVPWITTVFLPK